MAVEHERKGMRTKLKVKKQPVHLRHRRSWEGIGGGTERRSRTGWVNWIGGSSLLGTEGHGGALGFLVTSYVGVGEGRWVRCMGNKVVCEKGRH